MPQKILHPFALALASGFTSLGCLFVQPQRAGHGAPSAGYEPAAAEEQAAPGKSGVNRDRNPNLGREQANVGRAQPLPKMVPTTVELRSDCNKSVPVFYGDGKPGYSSGRKSSISSEPRKSDGTLTIWLIDDHENGLSNVKITPDTKRVTVNRDCTSFKTE
jgi:hypothetical protein